MSTSTFRAFQASARLAHQQGQDECQIDAAWSSLQCSSDHTQLTSAAKTTFSSLSAIREHVDVVFPPIAAGPVAPSSHDSPEGKDKPADVVTVASTAAAGVLDEFSDLMYWRMTIVESLGASPADARGLGATDADVAEPSGATLAAGSEGR